MSNSEAYSTLEVRHSSQLPEVVDPEQYQKQFAGPQPVPGQAQYANGALNPYPPAEGYYGYGMAPAAPGHSPISQYDVASMATYQHSPTGLYDANNVKLAYDQNGQPIPPTDGDGEKKARRKICGVTPTTFYIILGVVLAIIVAAVVGGVAGSLSSRNSSNGDDEQSNQEPSTGGSEDKNSTETNSEPLILSGSRLTSTNWTDPDGVTHRAVFFQDVYDAIIVCQWDSKDKKWEKTNITDQLAPSTSPIDVVSGTPLASAAIDDKGLNAFEVHLWFLDPTSHIKSVARLKATDSSSGWKIDTLGDAVLETRPGSLLAATWQRPWSNDELGSWLVAYQRPSDGAVKTANSSHWTVSDVAVPGDTVVNNSSLAIIPQRRGTFLDRVSLVSQGLSGTTSSMQLSSYDAGWDLSGRDVLINNLPNPSRMQHFAATMWDNWSNFLYLGLLDGGDMVGTHFDGKTFASVDNINFSGGPDRNFTAISMTTDAMLYAISNDEVLEYSVDTSFPSNLRYVGKVFPTEDNE